MTTWIITTGNSDIQLNTDANWTRGQKFFTTAREKEPLCHCQGTGQDFIEPKKEKNTNFFPVAARVLGLVYQDHEHCYSDLVFPLLDVLIKEFQDKKSPDRVYIILTDQEELFETSDIKNSPCPFWQDTCTLKPLFEWYFQTKLKLKPDFITLQPSVNNRGLDHWDQVLTLVTEELTKIQQDDVFYISHQASTPAISSAVQFVSIGYFSNVKFLIVNRYYEENNIKTSPEIIPISSYWKQLQIQKAKKLITDGFPGSALALLKEVGYNNSEKIKELESYIDLFNIKTIDTGDEFDPTQAIKRVRKTLDLIEYFLKQENYLQAIILLSAAQETFLKASISLYLQKHIPGGFKEWNEKGLLLNLKETKIQEVIKQLKLDKGDNHKFQNSHKLFPLLKEFTKTVDNDYWQLLIWSSTEKREHEFDRRNQLMHNLRGVKKEEMILYLTDPEELRKYLEDKVSYCSNSQRINLDQSVDEVYRNEIKGKFISALKTLCEWTENDYIPLEHHLEKLAKSL
ncbi:MULTISPECIES: hypothetical protein [unclassified Microcystis]|jgi:hypothetical protein|uniref:hypothetical protein n=1 Tax=unclassified Microcystis TaxID=2643300 RepID=UPI0022C00253|nr:MULTISPECIES: hypothetical protein [unclassified Microcystis]MCA2691176.1 hypothetical protein [Microcystis sp. M034S2]MCA2751791.1 hypothetical protein [Microcystis sp. M144S2]MCZ8202573.1 hypothetical protein [Microcystis sp. LE19-55.1A]MCZ8305129.1 hypothetical protein [Microcystis sp. LE19-98.1E]